MPAPILATKLYITPARPDAVLRPRLIERLNEGFCFGRKLILISAPAGFGKTTLVSEWLEGCKQPAAWLSLDEGDSDLTRFLTYLVAALQMIAPDLGAGALAAFQSAQPPPTETILTSLLNEIATLPGPFILVLDDYHAIDSQTVDQALTFLVEHQPPQMHLVIATREDPALPVARLRVRGQLTELRAADLRFTPAEAADFLNRSMGLSLSAEDVAALEARTEGWIAGLQLAALSMQGRSDTASFIRAFTGSHRFVLDYLAGEVLERQPEGVRNFLLHTAVLDRLNASLCNAVTQRGDGNDMLEALERGNLFLVPLDDQRLWYRYHHLFADVLRAHLTATQPKQVYGLHFRASVWYEHNGFLPEAIRHALSAKDLERAADLIEKVWLSMDLDYQSAAWLTWAKELPDDIIRARPVLCAGYGWALLGIGEIEASETRLRDAERWLNPADTLSEDSSTRMVVVDKDEFRSLAASIAAARAYRALALEDIPATKMYAHQALSLVADDESIHRTQATALLGMAEYAGGNLPAAKENFLAFQAMMWQANNIANAISITYILANIMLIQGLLQEVVGAYRQALLLAAKKGAPVFLGASDIYRGLSEVLCEQGDLEGAEQNLQIAKQMGEKSALTGWPHRLCIAQARMQEARGDLEGALALLDEAERQYVRNPLPDRSIATLKARTWLRQGQIAEAISWASDQSLSPDDDLSYLREFEHLTLARLLITQYEAHRSENYLQAALGLVDRLLQAAEEGGRIGSVIEILILRSLAHQAQGDQPRALASLERALVLAEPEGYVRTFVDEGEPVRLLIADFRLLIEKRKREQDHILIRYVGELLAAFYPPKVGQPFVSDYQKSAIVNQQHLHLRRAPAQVQVSSIVEPLSERELEVLRLLRSDLTGPEMARQLIITINTLRTHTKNIFGKLGVNNRRAAVKRAEELGIL